MVCSSPNRYIIGLCSLLLVFVISIAFANIFPYQDTFEDTSSSVDHHHTIANGAGIEVGVDEDDGSDEETNHGVVLIDSYTLLSTSGETIDDIQSFSSAIEDDASTSSIIKSSDKTTVPNASMPNLIDNNNILEAEAADEQPDSTININNDNDIDLNHQDDDEDILQRCIYSIKHANLNSNNMMDTYEYIIFLQNLIKSSRLYDEMTELKFYNDLPEELTNNFESLSCLCSFALCCIDGIGIYIDKSDDGSLETICVDTMNVIEETLG